MPKKKSFKKFFVKLLSIIFLFLIVTKIFILDIKIIRGKSMQPALNSGDIIFIFKLAYGIKTPFKNSYLIRWAKPKIDDIVVYRINEYFSVKRIVGNSDSAIEFFSNIDYTEKDCLTIANNEYKMKINTKIVNLTAIQFRNLGGFAEKAKQKIPKDTVLALGDNLNKSYDSRDYGFVFIDCIYGKVLLWK